MQDRYAGDVGDFGKFAILQALSPGRRLGVGWYLTSGQGEANNDGRHLDYLGDRARFERLAPPVFSALGAFVTGFRSRNVPRTVASLEQLGLLAPSTRFHALLCPAPGEERGRWQTDLVTALRGSDLVFLDPDNGFEGAQPSHKSVRHSELLALRERGRALLVYHHQTRRKGGADAEVRHQLRQLSEHGFEGVRAVRLRPYSSRFYFLLDGNVQLHARLDAFAATWGSEAELYP